MKTKISLLFLAVLLLILSGCYTQIKMVDRQEPPPESYQEPPADYEDYAYQDTAAADSEYYVDTEINNYYIYNTPGYWDPWYSPGWNLSFGFSMGWWDPYWAWNPYYPWYSYCCYYPYPYPYDPWWGYPYPVNPIYYGKRPFGRRTFTGPRTIERNSGPPPERHLAGSDNRRIVGRSAGGSSTTSDVQGSDSRRIVRSGERKTQLSTQKTVPPKRHIRRTRSNTSHSRTVAKGRASSRSSSRYRPAYRGTRTISHSTSRSYSPRSSTRSHSTSRGSTSRRSSSSSRSSSRSGSSRSVQRR